jgi:hypothetical protein
MTARANHRLVRPNPFGVACFAVFFAAALASAPLTHPMSCSGACAGDVVAGLVSQPDGSGGAPACHGGTDGRGAGSGGCTCTEDCCSLLAQFVAAPLVTDDAAPALLALQALPVPPDDAQRAPAARLLPYPNGPPATS